MVFKYKIKDTYIIDDINDKDICIYFTELINNKYIPSTIYINRYNGNVKMYGNDNSNNTTCIQWNNYKIINNYKKINFNKCNYNFNKFISNNRFKFDDSINFDLYIPIHIQSLY